MLDPKTPPAPTLLYDDQCGVCRGIARWVHRAAQAKTGERTIIERPIGSDPDALRALNPALDIWDAYATIHVLMPDGSMKLGGEAVAEVFRRVRSTRWFAWCFAIGIFGWRPFQAVLDLAYAILADIRPLFGCESCGSPSRPVRALRWLIRSVRAMFGKPHHRRPTKHFSHRAVAAVHT